MSLKNLFKYNVFTIIKFKNSKKLKFSDISTSKTALTQAITRGKINKMVVWKIKIIVRYCKLLTYVFRKISLNIMYLQ